MIEKGLNNSKWPSYTYKQLFIFLNIYFNKYISLIISEIDPIIIVITLIVTVIQKSNDNDWQYVS